MPEKRKEEAQAAKFDQTLAIEPDVIFIGAGPAGVWNAILLKIAKPHLSILMKEKIQVRKQVLHIEKNSFSKAYSIPILKQFIDTLPATIKIDELEDKLRAFATTNLGIEIECENITDVETQIRYKYPKAKVIVGSDGTHSLVRKQIFGSAPTLESLETMTDDELSVLLLETKASHAFPFVDPILKQDLEYFCIVSYEVKGATRPLSKWNPLEIPSVLISSHYLFSEHVGKEENGITTVYMRAIINKETYEALRGPKEDRAIGKNPIGFAEIEKIAPKLAETIALWKNNRARKTNEQVHTPPQATTTILSIHHNEELYKIQDNVLYVLAGESFAAVPFYRSVNMCFKAAEPTMKGVELFLDEQAADLLPVVEKGTKAESYFSSFKKAISRFLPSSSISSASAEPPLNTLDECADTVKSIFNQESRQAKIKDSKLHVAQSTHKISHSSYDTSVQISQKVPDSVHWSWGKLPPSAEPQANSSEQGMRKKAKC